MNAERVDKHLNAAADDLAKAYAQVEYLRDELAGTPLAAERDALAAKVDALGKDVSAMIRKVEEVAKKKPGRP